MSVKKLTEVLVSTGITLALAVTFVGCGSQNLTKEKKSPAEKTSESQNDQQNKSTNSSLSLATPGDLPAEVDEVEISLSRVSFVVGAGQEIHRLPSLTFAVNGQPIQIKDLEAGDYWIIVTFRNRASGRVHSMGDGRATVESGKLATAHVAMKKVEDGTGGLVVVPQDGNLLSKLDSIARPDSVPPVSCPPIAKATVCVQGAVLMASIGNYCFSAIHGCGNKPRPYSFKRKPNSCEFEPLPMFFTILPDSECDGMSLAYWDGVDASLSR